MPRFIGNNNGNLIGKRTVQIRVSSGLTMRIPTTRISSSGFIQYNLTRADKIYSVIYRRKTEELIQKPIRNRYLCERILHVTSGMVHNHNRYRDIALYTEIPN